MFSEHRELNEKDNKLKLSKVEVKLKDDVFNVDKVIHLLYKDKLLDKFCYEKVTSKVTTKEKTSELIDSLCKLYADVEGVPTYELLIKALFRTGQKKLALQIEPEWPPEKTPKQVYVTMKILWVFSDGKHCTYTMELLEKVSKIESEHDGSFDSLVEPNAQYAIYRGTFDTADTEVYCVSTDRSDHQTVSMVTADAIKRYDPDLVLLSGVCAGKEGDTKIGDIVICREAFNVDIGAVHSKSGTKFDAKAESAKDISALRVHLELLDEKKTGLWANRIYQLPIPRVSRRYEIYWLTRLYLELTQFKDDEWLNKIGWDVSNLLKIRTENNSKVLQKYVPSWGTNFIEYLTNKTESWLPEEQSPLTAKPTDELIERVKSGCFFDEDFPQQESLDREPKLIIAPICTNLSIRQDSGKVFEELSRINHTIVACDANTWGFYQQAAQCHKSQRFIAVKGVISHADGITEEALIPHVIQQCGCVLIDTIRYFRNVIGPS